MDTSATIESSCFDCIHLEVVNTDVIYRCGVLGHHMTYIQATKLNHCSSKQQEPEGVFAFNGNLPGEEVIEEFYKVCVVYALKIGNPFTIRDLLNDADYENKNSLWMLLEALVQRGYLVKSRGKIRTMQLHTYVVNTYWPIKWEDL